MQNEKKYSAICENCLYFEKNVCFVMPGEDINVNPERKGCSRGKFNEYNVCYSLPEKTRLTRIKEELDAS